MRLAAEGERRGNKEGFPSLTLPSLPPAPLPHPQTLQKLEVPLIDSEICSRLYWRGAGQEAITEDMLCAGYLEGQRDACLVSTDLLPNFVPLSVVPTPPPQSA